MGKRENTSVGHKKSKRHKSAHKSKSSHKHEKDSQDDEDQQYNDSPFIEELENELDNLIDVEQTVEIETESAPTPPQPVVASPSVHKLPSLKKKSNSGKTITPSSTSITPPASISVSGASNATMTSKQTSKAPKRRRESGTSSDEERWLTAIESGKLDDVDDEMKKIKDPKLMTARQRAMYERNTNREPSPGRETMLMSLPTGYREKEKPQTAEDIQKAALKSQKRKQLADEKREKDKKKTMERLLKKQDTGKQRFGGRGKGTKTEEPRISYRNTLDGIFINLPVGHDFPLTKQTAKSPPAVQLCGIVGCGQPKVYNCSKTNVPLCSFECYRKNVQSIRQIMC